MDYGESAPAEAQFPRAGDDRRAAILGQLERLRNSRAFRHSDRAKQFLSYVVEHALQGHAESLKERTIGVELFHRSPAYLTGDDPIVRVKAGEVRRRLAQYYAEEEQAPEVRIEIPVGSYIPEFHWRASADAMNPPGKSGVVTGRGRKPRLRAWKMAVIAIGLVLASIFIVGVRHAKAPTSTLDRFWSPVFTTSQPVLICVAKPIVYRPSMNLYRTYSQTHPTEFRTEVERYDKALPLDPKQTIAWGDMDEAREFGVAMGDAYVAAQLSALFARINKPSQVRIGSHYSFADLRNSPAVLVGAFNNRWTLQMTSTLRFVFAEEEGRAWIEDRSSPGKVWSYGLGPHGEVAEDYGVVTRLLDSKTGQVLIAAAGIGEHGTQAAADLISGPEYLREGLRSAPPDWQKKNLQVVVQTSVIENVAGPPRVIAAYFW